MAAQASRMRHFHCWHVVGQHCRALVWPTAGDAKSHRGATEEASAPVQQAVSLRGGLRRDALSGSMHGSMAQLRRHPAAQHSGQLRMYGSRHFLADIVEHVPP